ncbi:hypothetical protein JL720_2799 [Aureococcus anophagefferens]|nr:hypothetical protein JL720_2799 [Aureococcus anophagefferens]
MASNVARVLDEKLANAECQDPKGMYFDGSSWVKGEAPGTVPKTKAIFHGQMNGKFACGFYDQTNPYGEEDPLDTLENWHKEFNETMTEVEVDGKPYYEYGADKGGRKLKAAP